MFSSFEGQYRQKPIQSLRGSSKTEERGEFLQRTQAERQKREDQRTQQKCSIKIQAYYRSYIARKKQIAKWRMLFESIADRQLRSGAPTSTEYCLLAKLLWRIFDVKVDGDRLVQVCMNYMREHNNSTLTVTTSTFANVYLLQRLLILCLHYLKHIAPTNQPIAVPMRMLEIFTSPKAYSSSSDSTSQSAEETVYGVYKHLVKHGYFECMRCLLNNKVPSCIENTTTPMATSIFDLIMKPIRFAETQSDTHFSKHILQAVCSSLLSPTYSDQIASFLIPAMAYAQYPFPLVELIQALLPRNISQNDFNTSNSRSVKKSKTSKSGMLKNTRSKNMQNTENFIDLTGGEYFNSEIDVMSNMLDDNKDKGKRDELREIGGSPWLLHSFLVISEEKIDSLSPTHKLHYILALEHLISYLPLPPTRHTDHDSDSDDDVSMDIEASMSLESIRQECLRHLESPSLVQCLLTSIRNNPTPQLYTAVCVICCTLLSQQSIPVHKFRLLYSLAFSSTFLRYLWKSCMSSHIMSATGSKTPLLYMLSTGLPMSKYVTDTIVPLLTVFCSLFTHSLLTLDDRDFFNNNDRELSSSMMPFTTSDLVHMSVLLRDSCLGIVELAHPDSKHIVHEDYKHILESKAPNKWIQSDLDYQEQLTAKWAFLFKVISGLVRHIYNRDVRRQFCPNQHWLSKQITIQYERPTQMYRAQNAMFVRRFGPGRLRSNIRTLDEDEGPPLSNKEIRKLVILTEIPFVVPFEERVRVLQRLVSDDKELSQGDADLAPYVGSSINVMIRRNYIYEDAFEKLSPDNEPSLKPRMRVQLVNAVGLEEAGVDGGGLFREFLNELLKAGFDPNRGFFCNTVDNQLYPNPQAYLVNADFQKHYFFLGRMLGKALYENMLVEMPFANFFLSKILSRHGTNLDIHHLASLDPQMHKQLTHLKKYEGDVADLALDFTIVRNYFGQTKVVELKPGGSNIPVTNDNHIEYVHLMADYFLNKQMRQHCAAFRQGMADVIDLDWLAMFDHHELQVLISGALTPIDLNDLRRHTNYSGGYTYDHKVIALFWEVVATFTDEERRQLLKFVTSCSRPPLLGFKDLFPAFCIHHAGHEPDRLPTSSTCMNLLKLPEFKDESTLRSKLLYAIESGAGFELS